MSNNLESTPDIDPALGSGKGVEGDFPLDQVVIDRQPRSP